MIDEAFVYENGKIYYSISDTGILIDKYTYKPGEQFTFIIYPNQQILFEYERGVKIGIWNRKIRIKKSNVENPLTNLYWQGNES